MINNKKVKLVAATVATFTIVTMIHLAMCSLTELALPSTAAFSFNDIAYIATILSVALYIALPRELSIPITYTIIGTICTVILFLLISTFATVYITIACVLFVTGLWVWKILSPSTFEIFATEYNYSANS